VNAPTPIEAIVLAGGLGTRLRAAVPDLPKVMAPVAGQPFLAHVLRRLERLGIERAVLAVGYRRETIVAHFGARLGRIALDYSVEERLLGTGGGIRQALARTSGSPVLVLNGDSHVDFDLEPMRAQHERHAALITVATVEVPDKARYGALQLSGERLTGFVEKGGGGPGWINAGVYLLSREIAALFPEVPVFSFENDFLVPRVAELRPLAWRCAGAFIDIGVPEDYARAQALFA
jgi:D-glycero-alpha-D-manno-heptose 1-phosphate guanylyltransferase